MTPLPPVDSRRLRRFELFAGLPEPVLNGLAGATRVEKFPAGACIWRQGEENRLVLFIEHGLAVTSRQTREGVDRAYGIYGPGDSLGVFAIWAGMRYPTNALALNSGLIALGLDTDALVRCAEREPALAEPLRGEIGRFTESFLRKIDIVSAGAVSTRIATLLAILIERYGTTTATRRACLPYKLTLAQVGSITDARVETVARVFSEWKRQGWLATDSEGIHVLELDRLHALVQAWTAASAPDRPG